MSRRRSAGFVMVMLGWLFCIATVMHIRHFRHFGIDYLSVYSSSRCLLDGCNPYSGPETKAEFLAHGGTVAETDSSDINNLGAFSPYYAGYPPTSLFYFMPLAALPWPFSWHLWLVISLTLYGLTALLFSALCSDYSPWVSNFCLACFLAMQGTGVFLLQPTILAATACCLGLWCFLQGRWIKVGILCFALSLALKPHLGVFVLLYFFLANSVSRKRALQVIGVTVILCLPALLWANAHPGTKHWLQSYTTNVKGITSRGHLSDPGPSDVEDGTQIADLQTVVSIFHNDPAFYNPIVWAFSLLLLATWGYQAYRLPPSREKDLINVAFIAPFSLLPVYHRVYDSLLLLAMYPALALLLKKAPRWGTAGACLSVAFAVVISPKYYKLLLTACLPALRATIGAAFGDKVFIILFRRPIALSLSALTMFFLVVLYRVLPELSGVE